jgi:hypothetical protein
LQTETITAQALQGTLPTAGRTLSYTVKNVLGQTVRSGKIDADQDGKIVFTVFQTMTLAPGPYDVTVRDDGGAVGTASFLV